MKYKVTHNTTYEYSAAVPVCQNQVHLTPREGEGQACTFHRLNVNPAPSSIQKRTDYFGNTTNLFAITCSHRKLSVTATSNVEVNRSEIVDVHTSAAWEVVRDGLPADLSRTGLDVYQFCFSSARAPRLTPLAEYAVASFTAGRPILASAQDLTSRIHRDFKYDSQATTVSTPVSDVFRKRRGVCQDLAHLQIACLRSLGLAARYVSGYLRTEPLPGRPRLVGVDASHAWVAIFCGDRGWIDVDPTNDTFVANDHITVGVGRDYDDVAPIRGMFVGGEHTMTVEVDVVPEE